MGLIIVGVGRGGVELWGARIEHYGEGYGGEQCQRFAFDTHVSPLKGEPGQVVERKRVAAHVSEVNWFAIIEIEYSEIALGMLVSVRSMR
jgi:hypothetical protein